MKATTPPKNCHTDQKKPCTLSRVNSRASKALAGPQGPQIRAEMDCMIVENGNAVSDAELLLALQIIKKAAARARAVYPPEVLRNHLASMGMSAGKIVSALATR